MWLHRPWAPEFAPQTSHMSALTFHTSCLQLLPCQNCLAASASALILIPMKTPPFELSLPITPLRSQEPQSRVTVSSSALQLSLQFSPSKTLNHCSINEEYYPPEKGKQMVRVYGHEPHGHEPHKPYQVWIHAWVWGWLSYKSWYGVKKMSKWLTEWE